MASIENTEPPTKETAALTVKDDPPLGPDGKPLSKNALKKLLKDKEKAVKEQAKAERRAAEEAEKKARAANDPSKELYGPLEARHLASLPADVRNVFSLKRLEAGTTVLLGAFVYEVRSQSAKLHFLRLRKNGQTVQAVVAAGDKISTQMAKWAASITPESYVKVVGTVAETKEEIQSSSIKQVEIQVSRIYVESAAPEQLALKPADAQNSDPGRPKVLLHTKLDNRVLDMRCEVATSIIDVADAVAQYFAEYLRSEDFKSINTPKLLGGASEGGSEVFEVGYFGAKAFLAQSPQLHKQMSIAGGQERVFHIGPVFRAETSNTSRHMTEFTGLDLEMTIIRDYQEVLDIVEGSLIAIFKGLTKNRVQEIETIGKQYEAEPFVFPEDGKVLRLKFTEGARLLQEAGYDQSENEDLSTETEKALGALVKEKYKTDIFVLDKYPLSARPFYTMPSESDPGYSNSFDIIMRGQEICSGAQRIHNYDLLISRINAQTEKKVDPEGEGLKAYIDAIRVGAPQHGGVGIGLERVVMLFLGLPNVKLASLFTRDPSRLAP
ncbi:MAG: aspartate--tRNA ligase dps1 [Vezdaea aestivalis]|nr:MAG: aspartate--tRNA ligase dps1 [Vezdaea aestivalis]